MIRGTAIDLAAFVMVARERSFTRAAAQLGVSPSALSHAMRALEEKLGVRLLTRTTRSVALTEAGERLFNGVGPHLDGIENELSSLTELRDRPAGTVRLTATEYAADALIWPALEKLLPHYPDIRVEISIDYGLTDIVAGRFDAGVRTGDIIANDMIAVPIGPEMRMVVVGSPAYFTQNAIPQVPQDLVGHNCINLRLPTHGGLYAWEFEKDGRALNVRVEGQLVYNMSQPKLRAAVAGRGLAYLPEAQVQRHVEAGELVKVLEDWCAPFPGYHLYYPSRRQPTAAFRLVLEALRYRG